LFPGSNENGKQKIKQGKTQCQPKQIQWNAGDSMESVEAFF